MRSTSVAARLQHTADAGRARSREELAVLLDDMGDLTPAEIVARTSADPAVWVDELAAAGRIVLVESAGGARWVPADLVDEYALAFGGSPAGASTEPVDRPGRPGRAEEARRRILDRYLRHSGPVTVAALTRRYPFPPEWLARELEAGVDRAPRPSRRGRFTPAAGRAEVPRVARSTWT